MGYTSLYFIENAHVLDLTVLYTSLLFDRHLEAFWGAADLSVVYAFLLLTHETNMFLKHAKIKEIHRCAHARCRLAGTIWRSQKANYILNLDFFVAKWTPPPRRHRATRIPLPDR